LVDKAASQRAKRAALTHVVGGDLFDSPWVRRLSRVSFLGPLSRLETGKSSMTRLDHAQSVSSLALEACQRAGLGGETTRFFAVACLLHDIGHFPLSHAAEPAIRQSLGVDHHGLGRWIVLGEGPIGRARSLRPTLERMHLDPEQIWAAIDGKGHLSEVAQLLQAPINFDTLDGITRVARAFRLPSPSLKNLCIDRVDGRWVISNHRLADFDAFWRLKHRVYHEIINRPANVLAEARLCEIVAARAESKLFEWLEDFDDDALYRVLGAEVTAEFLPNASDDQSYRFTAEERSDAILARKCRSYDVDGSVFGSGDGLELESWSRRYRQSKYKANLIGRAKQLEIQGLFSDEQGPEI
jgi:hypothetical protein